MSLFFEQQALACYKAIALIRAVEETIADNYFPDSGEQLMRCPVHLSIGQEAAAVSVMSHLEKLDQVYSTHRSHAHYIARGGNIRKMFGELMGRESGCLAGRGGSMHLKDLSVNFMMSVPIVGSVLPLAVGAALAKKIKGEEGLVVVFVGDGSLEEGTWHEAANFSAVQNLPILFACENNNYYVYSHIKDSQPPLALSRFAGAHGIYHVESDGNDIAVAFDAAADAIGFIRKEKKPSFLSMATYRHLEHCGPSNDDDLHYRPEKEVEEWLLRDPLKISSDIMIERFEYSQKSLQEMYLDNKKMALKLYNEVCKDKLPSYSSILNLEYPLTEGGDVERF